MSLRKYINDTVYDCLSGLPSSNYTVNQKYKELSLTANTPTEINYVINDVGIDYKDYESQQTNNKLSQRLITALVYIKARFIVKSNTNGSLMEDKIASVSEDIDNVIIDYPLNTTKNEIKYNLTLYNFRLLGYSPDIEVNDNEGSIEFYCEMQVIQNYK